MSAATNDDTCPLLAQPQAGSVVKHKFSGVVETNLVTLSGRAEDFALGPARSLLHDPWAASVLECLQYKRRHTTGDAAFLAGIVRRAMLFDGWTREFLAANKETGCTVLHLACGLDSRAFRLGKERLGGGEAQGHAKGQVKWVDVDLPEVVDVRRKVFPATQGDYTILGIDVTDPDWLDQFPPDKPVLVIAEGLLMYLTECTVAELVHKLVHRFPAGSQLLADMAGKSMVRMSSWNRPIATTGAVFTYGVGDATDLSAYAPKGEGKDMRVLNACRIWDLPAMESGPWMLWLVAMLARFTAWLGLKPMFVYARYQW
jgi:O-methyltransferase involved in polyketide biosynthesis